MNSKRMILLSIHEEYYKRIVCGKKLFEFRKRLPSGMKIGDGVALYCTQPICKVVAWFIVTGVWQGAPSALWLKTHKVSGISREKFRRYFKGRSMAYALAIGALHVLKCGMELIDLRGADSPPQSFIRLTETQSLKVRSAPAKRCIKFNRVLDSRNGTAELRGEGWCRGRKEKTAGRL